MFRSYTRLANGVFVLLILVAGGRRKKIRKRKLGKDEETDCWEIEEKGHCWLERKQVGFFFGGVLI